jgi:hypothetical protein
MDTMRYKTAAHPSHPAYGRTGSQRHLQHRRPTQRPGLKFSLRGVTAMAAAGVDTANPESYAEATACDPIVRALIGRSDVMLDPALTLGETRVTVELADGTQLTGAGSKKFENDAAVLRRALSAKFLGLAAPLVSAESAAAIVREVLDEPLGPLSAVILRLCVPISDGAAPDNVKVQA